MQDKSPSHSKLSHKEHMAKFKAKFLQQIFQMDMLKLMWASRLLKYQCNISIILYASKICGIVSKPTKQNFTGYKTSHTRGSQFI